MGQGSYKRYERKRKIILIYIIIMKKIYWGGLLLATVVLFYAYSKECPKNCVKIGIGSCKCNGPASV